MKVIQDVESWLRANFKAGEAVDVTTSDSILVISRKLSQPKTLPYGLHKIGCMSNIMSYPSGERGKCTCHQPENVSSEECLGCKAVAMKCLVPLGLHSCEFGISSYNPGALPSNQIGSFAVPQPEGWENAVDEMFIAIHDGRIVERAIFTRPLNDEEISQIFSGKIFPFLKGYMNEPNWKQKINPTTCWEWAGAKTSDGYAHFKRAGVHNYAHRYMYWKFYGDIPQNTQIDHLCRNRACINPLHLEAVSQRENILRGESFSAKFAQKTHCPSGHEYNTSNTELYGKDKRFRKCRICTRECVEKYRKNRKEKNNA